MITALLILGWIVIVALVVFAALAIALICAASTLRCKNCGGFHDGECDSVDWRTE